MFLLSFAAAILSGFSGAIVGLGGGVFLVPALTLLGVDIRTAIAASMISVVASSCAASPNYLDNGMANLRLGVAVELPAALGTVVGATIAGWVDPSLLYVVLFVALVLSAVLEINSLRPSMQTCQLPVEKESPPPEEGPLPSGAGRSIGRGAPPPTPAATFSGTYWDPATRNQEPYAPARLYSGLALMGGSGVISGILGIGAGALRVAIMDGLMGLPVKASVGTATFMLGTTATGGALVFLIRGDVDMGVTGPVVPGILLGANLGSRLMPRFQSTHIKVMLIVVLLFLALNMLSQGLGGWKIG